MLKVFVVILNWNRPKDTLECVESVRRLRVEGYKINVVIVDNASTDESVDKFNKLKGNSRHVTGRKYKLEVLKNEENLGFAGGNNVGIEYSLKHGADFVLILNNDTRVHPDLMVRFIEVAKRISDFGAASPKIYFEKGFEFHKARYKKSDMGRILWYAGGEIDWDNVYGKTRGVDEVDKDLYNKIEDTDFATGTCMFISRKALEDVGLFDKKYFMYYEDTDLSVRIKKSAFKILYVPQAIVWHKVAQSSGIGSELNDYFITRNRLLFGFRFARFRTKLALFRESLKLFLKGRKWQKIGVKDFYTGNFEKGSWR